MKSSSSFSRRGPDLVAEELAAVLSKKTSYEFKDLFTVVHTNLKARNAARGGEEMLRLRAYEKLQRLVELGIVKRTGKAYRGIPSAVAGFIEEAAAQNQEFEASKRSRRTETTAK